MKGQVLFKCCAYLMCAPYFGQSSMVHNLSLCQKITGMVKLFQIESLIIVRGLEWIMCKVSREKLDLDMSNKC